MATLDDVAQLLEQWHSALGEFLKGNPEPVKKMWSHREDVTLANPYGPPVRGWEQVAEVMDRAASQVRDGQLVSVEMVEKHATPEFAYTLWLEHVEGKLGGREDITPFSLRVTMIFRPEEGEWKIVHRHADPITTPQPAESVIQE